MAALEAHARSEGVLTLFLGSDDDYGATNLFGRDLGPDVVGNIAGIQMTGRRHPLTFYRRLGYEIVGLLPDVNGAGRPDIMLAKRL
jgi:aminoglycoside 6'-N-acetyltransferase I